MSLAKFNELVACKVVDKLKESFGVPEYEHAKIRGWIEALDWAKEAAEMQLDGFIDGTALREYLGRERVRVDRQILDLRANHSDPSTVYWEGRKASIEFLEYRLLDGEFNG